MKKNQVIPFLQIEGVHCFSCGTFLVGDLNERPCGCGDKLVLDAYDVPAPAEGVVQG